MYPCAYCIYTLCAINLFKKNTLQADVHELCEETRLLGNQKYSNKINAGG